MAIVPTMARIGLITAVTGFLVLVGRTDVVSASLFVVGMVLALIPTLALLVLSILVIALIIRVFRHNKLVLSMFLGLLISQSMILFFWFEGWTAASAFMKHWREIGRPVLDPQLEQKLMFGFGLLAALVFALTADYLINAFLSTASNAHEKNFYRKRIGILVLEACLLLSMHSSFANYRTPRDVNIPASISPDGTKEIQLVPMDAFIDINGLVIVREPHSLVWRTAGQIGDLLTEANGGRFGWSTDGSKAYLLLNLHDEKDFPILGYDFKEKKSTDAKTHQ